MNKTPKNIKVILPQLGGHFVCLSRSKMRYLSEIITVESLPSAPQESSEKMKLPSILKAKIAQPPTRTEDEWPKYDAVVLQRDENLHPILDEHSLEPRPEVLISVDRQDPASVNVMCDLIDIMRNWESSPDDEGAGVFRWGSICDTHHVENDKSATAWLQDKSKKYLLPSSCVSVCMSALNEGSMLRNKPERVMLASDGVYVHFVVSWRIKGQQPVNSQMVDKLVSHLAAHGVLIMQRGEFLHLCILETLGHKDSAMREPLCLLICDLSKRVLSKPKITSKVG